MQDAETGAIRLVDLSRANVREFGARRERERRELSSFFRSAGIGELQVISGEPYIESMLRYFRSHRDVRRRRR